MEQDSTSVVLSLVCRNSDGREIGTLDVIDNEYGIINVTCAECGPIGTASTIEKSVDLLTSHESIKAQHVVTCGYFALCDNEATCTIEHPVLGDVPACGSCAEFYVQHGGMVTQ